jgi:hypothetical protein
MPWNAFGLIAFGGKTIDNINGLAYRDKEVRTIALDRHWSPEDCGVAAGEATHRSADNESSANDFASGRYQSHARYPPTGPACLSSGFMHLTCPGFPGRFLCADHAATSVAV